MSTQPTVYDTTGISSDVAKQMAQLVANDTLANNPFTITGPNAKAVADAAAAINGATYAQPTDKPATGDAAAANDSHNFGDVSISGPNDAITQELKGYAKDTNGSNWFQTNFANYGLVILGVLLGLGALLISQKDTIIQVGKNIATDGIA